MEQLPLEVIFEDKYLLAINKPAGLVSEQEPHLKYTAQSMALDYVKAASKYPKKCFIGLPHRLDRPVTGVLLMAKKKSVLKSLVESFSKREIEKTYLAITENKPDNSERELVNWLSKDLVARKAIIHAQQVRDSWKVILKYKVIAENSSGCLLELKLITGKFHQIRAQLAHIGCSIIGDSHYGSKAVYKENAICLHAKSLAFKHPVSNELLTLAAKLPNDERWHSFDISQ